jgi:hypothetical protein
MTMKSFKNLPKPLYAALLAAPVLLAGCTQNGPWPMPTGYTYHHDEYKAPPGPQPVFKKWEYRHGVQEEPAPMPMQLEEQPVTAAEAVPPPVVAVAAATATTDSWQQAADELVARMVAAFGRPTEAVWLEADTSSPDSINFDKALRHALAAQKIGIADMPGASPFTLHYSAGDAGDSSGRLLLSLVLTSGGQRVESESGMYKFTDAVVIAPLPAPQSSATSSPAALTIDSSPTFVHEPPKTSGMADDIDPGPAVRPLVPEHKLNE